MNILSRLYENIIRENWYPKRLIYDSRFPLHAYNFENDTIILRANTFFKYMIDNIKVI